MQHIYILPLSAFHTAVTALSTLAQKMEKRMNAKTVRSRQRPGLKMMGVGVSVSCIMHTEVATKCTPCCTKYCCQQDMLKFGLNCTMPGAHWQKEHTVQCAGCEIMTGMSVVCPERGGRLYGQGGASWPRQNKIIIVIVLVFVRCLKCFTADIFCQKIHSG